MKPSTRVAAVALAAISAGLFVATRSVPSAVETAAADPSSATAAPEPQRTGATVATTDEAPEPAAAAPVADAAGSTRLTVTDRELYEEMRSVVEYYKDKPLPEHGPVHAVGDGIDSSERSAKLPKGTTFARFRYEYEKHDTNRLMNDLSWADGELAKMGYEARLAKGDLTDDDKEAGEQLLRRRRAIVSILDARARDERVRDRYQRVEVVYRDPAGN